jgi:hypothetical protein
MGPFWYETNTFDIRKTSLSESENKEMQNIQYNIVF